jgi:hypothetical protein
MTVRTLGRIAFACAMTTGMARADFLISNGSFETNGGVGTNVFADWTVVDQAQSSGSILVQTGIASPLNGFLTPLPPDGSFAAMSDQGGPGSHILYQDFVIPTDVSSGNVTFSLWVNNQNGLFFNLDTLDFTGAQNQQARVDILTSTSDPFSLAAGDVLLNLFQATANDSDYVDYSVDITALLVAHAGETLRLRFAEVDNQFFFNLGIDNVGLEVARGVPEPSTIVLAGLGLVGVIGIRLSRRMRRPAA